MSVTQTPRGPVDRDVERATLAAGLWSHTWWLEVRSEVGPGDYGIAAHQAIAAALDTLGDIGPYIPREVDAWTAGYWPSSLTTRAAAISTITDLEPIAAIAAIAKYADGRHLFDAAVVRDLAATRRRIAELDAELRELAG